MRNDCAVAECARHFGSRVCAVCELLQKLPDRVALGDGELTLCQERAGIFCSVWQSIGVGDGLGELPVCWQERTDGFTLLPTNALPVHRHA